MFSSKLFKRKKYEEKGGPRSFHKFTYQGIHIVLMGESHVKMPKDLATLYIKVFNDFIEKIGNVKLFLEKSQLPRQESEEKSSLPEEITFMDSMEHLSSTKMLQILCCDRRASDESLCDLHTFLMVQNQLGLEVQSMLTREESKRSNGTPFVHDSHYLEQMIRVMHTRLNKNLSLKDFYTWLDYHRDNLIDLEEKYSKENKLLHSYLVNCISMLNIAIGFLGQYEKDYRIIHGLPLRNYAELETSSSTLNTNDTNNESKSLTSATQTLCDFQCLIKQEQPSVSLSKIQSLIGEESESKTNSAASIENPFMMDMCLDMMTHKKTYTPLNELWRIYKLYIAYHYDATLVCDLWEQIKAGKEKGSTLLVVAGDLHIRNLSKFLKSFAEEDESILASKDGSVLSPQEINELLNDNFEPQSKNKCALM